LTRLVVDASVVVKWFLPEDHTEDARRLLESDFELLSPDLVRTEFGNVLWKRWRRDEIPPEAADEALRDLNGLPLDIHPSESLLHEEAWTVAERFDRSFYDGLYVALAVQAGVGS
jgi:predicted nucleic acid-binding protein